MRIHSNLTLITLALKRSELRQTQLRLPCNFTLLVNHSVRFLILRGINVCHVAVYKWTKKYVILMQSYVEMIKLPALGNAWRTDELYIKIRGNMKYMYAIIYLPNYSNSRWCAALTCALRYSASGPLDSLTFCLNNTISAAAADIPAFPSFLQ
jgi:hypothetical protein